MERIERARARLAGVIALILCGGLLAGCESRAYKLLHQEKVALEDEHARVQEQMQEVWEQSLKARIPLIQPIRSGEAMEINQRYIKSLNLRPAAHYKNKWRADVVYLSDTDGVVPNYILYLFDERGLNVGVFRKQPRTFRKQKLKKGEEVALEIKIDLIIGDTPRYYWIRYLD